LGDLSIVCICIVAASVQVFISVFLRRQPVFLTLCHMMACATLGYCLSLGKLTPIKPLKSKKQMWKICVLSTIFCATIVLGNASLKYIPISFNQAIGATTPLFTAFFAFAMQGEYV
jgi:drug/metabolite transporter (DMT)-like permease